MSECKRTIYKDGKIVATETMADKGLAFEDRMIARPDEVAKKSIWESRRELNYSTLH